MFCFPWRGAEEVMQHEDLLRSLETLETQRRVCYISAKGTQGLEFFTIAYETTLYFLLVSGY